ncbi:MAG: hypothetical protein K5979_00200 [Ruminococcus sp.]|nr:hypothetical protein [Ruminococcus sp.]
MNKNIYNNTANMKTLPVYQEEVTPKTTAFAVVDGENVKFESLDDVLRYPANIASLQAQPLNENARHVLGIIATYEYMTTKMICDCMNLLGIPVDQKKILAATERLRKTGLIHSFRFKAEDDSKGAIFIVHTLTKLGGENAMKALGISVPQVDTYNVVMNPALVKRKLATNQVLFAQLKHNASALKSFEKSKRLTATNEEHTVVKPSLVLQFKDESTLIYEVVRRGTFWKTEFKDKLERYKALQDSYDDSFADMPTMIICCEDEKHAREVHDIVKDIRVKSLFTHDLLLFGGSFNQHLFTFNDKNEPVYYRISFEEEKEIC